VEEEIILNLILSVGEINIILRSLGKHPFEEIASLISKIKTQGEEQLKLKESEQDLTEKTGE
jgi:hypothetical protein